jgi:hypothetical protein
MVGAEREKTVKFPAIAIKGGTFEFHDSDVSLRRCTKTALKNGWYRGLTILDAAGVLHTVRDARFVRNTGQKTYPGLFASKWIEVEPEISGERQLALEEARQLIRRGLTANRAFWESGGYDLAALLREIDRAESIEQIWSVITPLLTAGRSDRRER